MWLPARSCSPARSRRRAGPTLGRDLDCSRWPSPSSDLAHGQEQDLPGFLAPHPTTLRRSTTPDDPSHLTLSGAAGAAPRMTTLRTPSLQLSRLTATLHRPLSTLHDGRYRTPCKTRFRLAGCAFAGRESNPLGRFERFQIKSSSLPGLCLAQGQCCTPINNISSLACLPLSIRVNFCDLSQNAESLSIIPSAGLTTKNVLAPKALVRTATVRWPS